MFRLVESRWAYTLQFPLRRVGEFETDGDPRTILQNFANNKRHKEFEPAEGLDLTTKNDPNNELSTKPMSRELMPRE